MEVEKLEGDDDEQQNVVEVEFLYLQFYEVVYDEVVLCYFIVFFFCNICNLVNVNKLFILLVGILKEICECFGLNVDDIKQRRKKLLIE